MGLDPFAYKRVWMFAPALYSAFRKQNDPHWAYLSQEKQDEWLQYAGRVLFDLEASAEAPT